MAQRFIGIISRTKNSHQASLVADPATLGLCKVAADARFELWTDDPSQVLITASGQTQIVGRLFTRENRPVRTTDIAAEFDRQTDVPSRLSTQFWGQYVAFCWSAIGSVQVFRDPSGGLPCYVHETSSEIFAFSDIDLAVDLGLVRPQIDWLEVAACLAWVGLRPTKTAFHDIYEISQGYMLAIRGENYCELGRIWSPWSFVEPTGLKPEQLHEALQATISGAVRALALEFDKIQLSLSGGLDSSIVATALGGTDTVCVTLVAPGADGDERAQARLVADHLGLACFDTPYSFDDVDPTASSAAHLCRPVGSLGRMSFDNAQLRFARDRGSQALFTGFGGDNVFCLTRSGSPITDRLRTGGERWAAWQTVADVCNLTGCSVFDAVTLASRKLPRAAAGYRWQPQPKLLSQELLANLEEQPNHSWLDAPAKALPGKAAHIAMLMRPQNFAEGFARSAHLEMINPLLSQPIVEMCLSIPSWQWIEAGRDRAPARKAFADVLPAATLARTTKGGPGGFYRQLVEHYRSAIRERLLDGALVHQRLLDRAALESWLVAPVQGDFPHTRILDLCDAENWVRGHLQ